MNNIVPPKPYEPKTRKEKIIYYGVSFLIMIIILVILIPILNDISHAPDFIQPIELPLINLIPVTILIAVIITLIYFLFPTEGKTK